MTVVDFLALTRRSWKLLLITVLAGVLAGAAYGFLAPKTYQSSSSGFITSSGTDVFGGTEAMVNKASSYLPLLTSKPVLDKIAETAKVEPSSLNGRLSAGIAPGSTLIQVTATAGDPKSALTLANGALESLAVVIQDVQTKAGAESPLTVIPMQNAVAPTSPSSPNLKLALLAGALGGLVLGYLIVFARRVLDVRVRTGADLETLAGSGLLGRIPKVPGRSDDEDAFMKLAGEPLRQVRAGLRFASVDGTVKAIVVTSANQSEGKSTIAAALARVIAESEQPTLLIDADLRRPTVAHRFGMDGAVGLSEVLSGQVALGDVIKRTASNRHLMILPAGNIPPNPSEMLGSSAMRELIGQLVRECTVIIDAPPVLPVSDALLLATDADGVVFVAASGKTRKADVTAARHLLAQAKARVLGAVLNMVPRRDAADGYSYYRQYRSYYATTDAKAAGTAKTATKPAKKTDVARAARVAAPSAAAPSAAAPSADAPIRRRSTAERSMR